MRYLICLMALILISCSKDDTYCFECTTQIVVVQLNGGPLESETTRVRYCGKTDEDAESIEAAGTSRVITEFTDTQTTTTCKKQ
jgi:hypothetical protein